MEKSHRMGEFEVHNPEIENLLRDIGYLLKGTLHGKGHGFALFIFTHGDGGNFFYVADTQREDMIALLDEFKKKLLNAEN